MTINLVPVRSPLADRLRRALLPNEPPGVQKIVLEIDWQAGGGVVRMYVKRLADAGRIEAVCDELEAIPVADVVVGDDCTIELLGTPAPTY